MIDQPMTPPNWALLERELLRANTAACKEFFTRYFDDRGFVLCVERWGGDDGPDDAIENLLDWPILHAAGGNAWLDYLNGKNPTYPEQILRSDVSRIRSRVARMRADETTPDTRLADDPLKYNPASVQSLIELMMGGIYPGKNGLTLHCRLRYFDPIKQRAGVPPDVAALIESMTADEVVVTLVNTNQIHPRTVVVQAGGYAEHQFVSATGADGAEDINASHFSVKLSPGAGGRLTLKMERYVNQPTLTFPWDR